MRKRINPPIHSQLLLPSVVQERASCGNPADSLLDFAEANDIDVESGCRAGSCGSCQTEVKAGEVNYNQQPDADIAAGHCLLCISTPKNNLTLDA